MGEDLRRYSRAELEEVAQLAAGLGAGAVMRYAPDVVMPTEEISEGLGRVLADFDERREGAAGYSAEQLSGTRREPVIGPVAEGEEFPHG